MNIVIEEPPEYNPVELIRIAQAKMPSLRYRHFAIAFKCDVVTIGRWMCGNMKPSMPHRIWAAELKNKWGL
jgi:hypothetical protein